MKKVILFSFFLMSFASLIFSQAEPPDLVNYMAVIRDSLNVPLDGYYDMKFHFFSSDIAGDEILIDEHLAAGIGAVEVIDGMLNVHLGSGDVSDGTGPGTYISLKEVFRDYSTVYLEISIYNPNTSLWETFDPRTRVVSSGYALNADHLDGRNSSYFLDTSSTAQTKFAQLTLDLSGTLIGYGVEARGPTGGGYFVDSNHSGYAYVGYGDYGIKAYGYLAGGYFAHPDNTSFAALGSFTSGIAAYGSERGGYFEDNNNSGCAWVGYGDLGIEARGNLSGGYFAETNDSSYAYLGSNTSGIAAYGNEQGGYFEDHNNSGYAYVGYGDYGIMARGNFTGGYFQDLNNGGHAWVGYGNFGIHAHGNTTGGYFQDSTNSGLAYVGYGNRGIWGKGTFAGATFSHPDDTTYWADVSTSTHKIYGTGTASFVQNHPYDKSKVIAYAAPEGDEVAVYTRGTAQLINGEAFVKLGQSFSWVANPDIGLTALITPRGEQVVLSVDSLTTSEMIVSGPDGSNATFDYIVFGLRIGFEELAVVQEKDREAFLPASEVVLEPYAQSPDLRAFNAFERFKRMRQTIGETGEIDLTSSLALAHAIDENKQEILENAREQMEKGKMKLGHRPEENRRLTPEALRGTEQPQLHSPELIDEPERIVSASIPMDKEGNIHAKSFRSSSTDLTRNLPVSEVVETGDVLVVDPLDPQMMKPGDKISDPTVVGIVAGEPGVILGQKQIEAQLEQSTVAVALSGIVLCRVDASYEAIRIGDLLTTSSTKGHAMKSPDHAPGTIIGKALEPLNAGTGLIKVLVMMR